MTWVGYVIIPAMILLAAPQLDASPAVRPRVCDVPEGSPFRAHASTRSFSSSYTAAVRWEKQ